ncbi:MAG: c-type cytochrome [Daejeonella sp.]|uniref:c-type cytochrome n=1 Tax=Daejeonella sp. JGW-45 TaxID=3034148 RepID=UPI0023ECBBB3|nr:c-type cytochrome [Daejeonella sp. JGW-45]
MKKAILILGICSVIIACNSNEKTGSSADSSSPGQDQSAVAQQPDVDTNVNKIGTDSPVASAGKGEELINKSDCLTCHKVDVKLLGPAYQDVAAKYAATDENIKMLAGKIINGGSGNWGDIPMAPHPSISEADATEMVKYILSLKK